MSHLCRTCIALFATLLGLATCTAVFAQEEADVLAVADAALERITEEDSVGLTDLMIEQAMIYVGTYQDGEYVVRTRTYAENRARGFEVDLVERGFDPTVMVSGAIAIVWYPYDIYVDSEWSHCGVDIFNMIKTNEGWRIASLTYNVQQPPDCKPHPNGAPQ